MQSLFGVIRISRSTQSGRDRSGWLLRWLMIALLLLVVLRTAWMCDDAFIILKSVDNFVSGQGPVFNAGERVQSFTSPLWMIVITPFYALTRDPYNTTIFLCIAITLVAAYLLCFKLACNPFSALLAMAVLVFSRSFIDYSTSGLENSLAHCIVFVFMIVFMLREAGFTKYFLLCFFAALGGFTRMDLMLVFVPALLYGWIEAGAYRWKNWGKGIGLTLAGFSPLIIWLVFSLIYYGTFFPNTAYAKLSTGIAQSALTLQGINYYLSSLSHDPITLYVLFCGLLMAFISRDWKKITLGIGVVLYFAYIVHVGGDFMNGRFFTAPLCIIVGILATMDVFKGGLTVAIPLAVVAAMGMWGSTPTILSDGSYGQYSTVIIDQRGVADERAFYYPTNGLFSNLPDCTLPCHAWVKDGMDARLSDELVLVTMTVGMYGYYAGREKHVIDLYALVDPLLARLPVVDPLNWRIGHFIRVLPEGYLQTLATGQNHIVDPNLAGYYQYLDIVVHGPIFDPARWKAIWLLNTGQLDYLLQSSDTASSMH